MTQVSNGIEREMVEAVAMAICSAEDRSRSVFAWRAMAEAAIRALDAARATMAEGHGAIPEESVTPLTPAQRAVADAIFEANCPPDVAERDPRLKVVLKAWFREGYRFGKDDYTPTPASPPAGAHTNSADSAATSPSRDAEDVATVADRRMLKRGPDDAGDVTGTSPAPAADARGEPHDPRGTAAFKNFHNNLCKRFGYTHDERDWWRDLASLEEHIAGLQSIAGKLPSPPQAEALSGIVADVRKHAKILREVEKFRQADLHDDWASAIEAALQGKGK